MHGRTEFSEVPEQVRDVMANSAAAVCLLGHLFNEFASGVCAFE